MSIHPPRMVLTQDMRRFIEQASHSSLPVLIEGETGTGKTMLAREIHRHGPRCSRSFVSLSCGSLPPSLLERELFGHKKGVFTGADRSAPGLAQAAAGGTLLLDDVDALPIELQPKILSLVEGGEVRALGSTEFQRLDLRIIATTNRTLAQAVHDKEFRSDLFFRLAILRHRLTPLKERSGSFSKFCKLLFASLCEANPRDPEVELRPCAMAALRRHTWPGNLRELGAVLARAYAGASGTTINQEHIEEALLLWDAPADSHVSNDRRPPRAEHDHQQLLVALNGQSVLPTFKEMEALLLLHVLTVTDGNQSEAARILGVSRNTIRRRLKEQMSPDSSLGEPL